MSPVQLIGVVTELAPLLRWATVEMVKRIPQEALDHPVGYAQRMADLIVWRGKDGTKLVAALEGLGESQQRIEAAVAGIESGQLAMANTLGAVQSLSMVGLGLTSLTGVCMMWRLKALDSRLNKLATQIKDIEVQLAANQKALLSSSLNYLDAFDSRNDSNDLRAALDKARESVHIYGDMTKAEIEGPRRVPVLNYRGRRYLLSLMTELHCLLLNDRHDEATHRVNEEERERMGQLVNATYQQTWAKSPEVYLHPKMADMGVTLATMTELYQQLKLAGALNDVELKDACDLFEQSRNNATVIIGV